MHRAVVCLCWSYWHVKSYSDNKAGVGSTLWANSGDFHGFKEDTTCAIWQSTTHVETPGEFWKHQLRVYQSSTPQSSESKKVKISLICRSGTLNFKVLCGDSLDLPVFYLLYCKIYPTGPIFETNSPINWSPDWEQPPLATSRFNTHHFCQSNLWVPASSSSAHSTPQSLIHLLASDVGAACPCSLTLSTSQSSSWLLRASAGSPSTPHPGSDLGWPFLLGTSLPTARTPMPLSLESYRACMDLCKGKRVAVTHPHVPEDWAYREST